MKWYYSNAQFYEAEGYTMWFLLLLLGVSVSVSAEQMIITHTHKQMVGVRVACKGDTAVRCGGIISSDLNASGQFCAHTAVYTHIPKDKREITDVLQEGILFLLIIESLQDELQYRLYDTTTGSMVPQGSGKCMRAAHTFSRSAHHVADRIWYVLTGQKSMFNTSITYAKEVPYKKNLSVKHICVAQHDGSEEYVVVATPTISIAPRWGGTIDNPLIFYSEYTNTNVRLMAVNMQKKRKIVTRYDGVTMHLTSSNDGSLYLFSSSRGNGTAQIYLIRNGALEQCTRNDATNACPVFNHDASSIYYCSDEKTGQPHIMVYHCMQKKSELIPVTGYCVSPAYNNTRKLLAYSKMVDGFLQIFVYDPATHKERQLTFDAGNHEDVTWSPCGNFFAYTHEFKEISRIRVHCYATGYERYITSAEVRCSYPAWSLF